MDPLPPRPRGSFGLLFFATVALALWGCSYLPIYDDVSVSQVTVTDHRDYMEMRPSTGNVNALGLMFWPGGLVEPSAYQASLGVFAARGYRVVIVKVPANLAITSIHKGKEVAQRLGGHWVAGGHSLGGTAAAWSISENQGAFRGLVLFASFPTQDKGLGSWDRPVLSISASQDGLATPEDIQKAKSLLPPSTRYVVIPGGNHSQFASYGAQDGDGTATISRQAQWNAMADAMEAVWASF